MTESIINRFSSIATDPIRSFRFYAEFSAVDGGAFDDRITSKSAAKTPPVSGKSTGWFGGFTSVSGLSTNIQALTYREGGYNTTVHQIPGMTTFSPVSFQRGVMYGNDQAMTWVRGLFSAAAGNGLATGAGKSFRVDVNLYVLDHPNAGNTVTALNAVDDVPRIGFKVHNAWISSLNYSDLNAGAGEILFENMTLVHEGLSAFFVKSDFTPVV
jgi:phage tail-like protein